MIAGGDFASVTVFPDALRHAMALAGPSIAEYAIVARGARWDVAIEPSPGVLFETACGDAASALRALCARYGVHVPEFDFGSWVAAKPGEKRRRIRAQGAVRDASCA